MSDTDANTPGTVPYRALLDAKVVPLPARAELPYLWPASGQCCCCAERVYMDPVRIVGDQQRRLRNVNSATAHSCPLDWQRMAQGDPVYRDGLLHVVWPGWRSTKPPNEWTEGLILVPAPTAHA